MGWAALPSPPAYFENQLATLNDHSFEDTERFARAYQRGLDANNGVDNGLRWKVHVLLWFAEQATRLPGDFVECGVNTGFMSSAMLTYLDWGSSGKTLYLLDTFAGPVEAQYSDEERVAGKIDEVRRSAEAGAYQTDFAMIERNFSQWPNVRIIRGPVPDTLPEVCGEAVAFLHLDMNCTAPEIAAAEYFWERITSGGFIVLDDYGGSSFMALKRAYDRFAAERAVGILSLPTGQGIIQKPPEA